MISDQQNIDNSTAGIIHWADLVIFLSSMNHLELDRITNWVGIFGKVTILAPENYEESLPAGINWQIYNQTLTRADIWNQYLSCSNTDWVLFLEDDEDIIFLDFPALECVNAKLWPPALISYEQQDKCTEFYQTRFVYNSGEKVFLGKNIPDCTKFIIDNNIDISNMPVQIIRNSHPFDKIDSTKELDIAEFAPQVYLLEGQRYFKERKYVHAAAQYRQLLKMKKLLPFDRLAAVNGLASCMTEQFKWQKALSLTGDSLKAEPLQKLPYLIEYRIYQLQNKWDDAYNALSRYYDCEQLHSRANYDISINEEEVLVNLAELSFKMGERAKASEYLNELFYTKNGNVDDAFLRNLLLLCIELKDLDKSIFYFNRIFDSIPENSDFDMEELNDIMGLFIKNGWYEFVYDVYNELYEKNPKVDEFRRRLIVVSVKTDRVEQARRLAVKVA